MLRSKNKDYSKYNFVENTRENRARVVDGSRLVAMYWNKPYEVYYDATRDVFKGRMSARSSYNPKMFGQYAVIGLKKEVNWGQAWARIANSMRSHGINQLISDLIEKMLIIGKPEMMRLAIIRSSYEESELYPKGLSYEERSAIEKRETEAWEAKHAEVLKGTRAWEILSLHTQNHTAVRLPRVVKMKLPKEHIEDAIEKVATGEKENDYVGRRGVKRDLSFSVWKKEGARGVKASYASEYAGCGNGAYYIPFSPTYAFYAEHD